MTLFFENQIPNEGSFVVWIDDEPNLIYAERFDLENYGFTTVFFKDAGVALNWFLSNQHEIHRISNIIIDLLMPVNNDSRLKNDITKLPVGLIFCEQLAKLTDWKDFKSKICLYTRTANTLTYSRAKAFAQVEGIRLEKKTASSRIAKELLL